MDFEIDLFATAIKYFYSISFRAINAHNNPQQLLTMQAHPGNWSIHIESFNSIVYNTTLELVKIFYFWLDVDYYSNQ